MFVVLSCRKRHRLAFLSLGIMATYGVSTSIDEGFVAIIVDRHLELGWFITMVQFLAFLAPNVIDRVCRRKSEDKLMEIGRLHIICGVLVSAGHGLVNVGTMHVNFSVGMLFKSGKILVLMIAGAVVNKHYFSPVAFLFGSMLCLGLWIFVMAEKHHHEVGAKDKQSSELRAIKSRYDSLGILCIFLGVLVSGFTNSLQERLIRSPLPLTLGNGEKERPNTSPQNARKEHLVLVQYAVAAAVLCMLCTVK